MNRISLETATKDSPRDRVSGCPSEFSDHFWYGLPFRRLGTRFDVSCLRVVEKSSWHWQPGLAQNASVQYTSHVCHRMLFLEKTKNQDEPISHDPWLVRCYLNHFGCVLCVPVYLLPRATGFQYLIPFQRWPPLEVSLHLTSCINRKHHNLPPISVVQAAHVQSDWVEHLKEPWTAQR